METAAGKEFSYPTQFQGDDGLIYISYTYNRETVKLRVVSENWIKSA